MMTLPAVDVHDRFRSDIVIYLYPMINLITEVRYLQCREPEVNLLVDERKGLLIGLSQRIKV